MSKDYYLGLDIGTNSVGWAVTNTKYEVLSAKRKSMWGVRLFDEGKTAEDRRTFRSARRRLRRQKNRVKLLQEFFAEEIAKIDEEFFLRLNESKFYPEDKVVDGFNTLFNDDNYKDKDFHKEYPTFYHLRKDLIEDSNKKDIRKIYLAIQHIMKLRGHFLFYGTNLDSIESFEEIFNELQDYLFDEYGERIECSDIKKFENILKSRDKTIRDKAKELKLVCKDLSSHQKVIIDLMAGKAVSVDKITDEEGFKENEEKKIDFKSASFEDKIDTIKSEIGEKYYLIEQIKAIYDWSILEEILNGERYISVAKVKNYNEHGKDLKILKRFIRKHRKDKYKEVFKINGNKLANYPAYVGKNSVGGRKKTIEKQVNKEDFYKYINKILKEVDTDDQDFHYIKKKIETNDFLNLQRSTNNSTIPNQINKLELIKILDNASKYYDFLNQVDEKNLSVKDKIIKIFEFRIPYYVGPLNGYSDKFSWLVRKADGKIYPWNFNDLIDIEESGERFIKRMTNKCSYLIGEDVLPKESILYSKFTVLNEINKLRINGESIDVELKQKIYKGLCLKEKKISQSKIKKFLVINGHMAKEDQLTGVDKNLGSSMKSYIDIEKIIGDKISNEEMVEKIILWISLFTTEEKIIYSKIEKEYGDLLDIDEMKKLSRLKYTGWGQLSEKLLSEIYTLDNETGEMINIISSLWNSNNNLMELLSLNYTFKKSIEDQNDENFGDGRINYDSLEELGLSPATKRSLWETISLVKEIKKIKGKDPKKIFIEVAREHGEKKRTDSRKKQLEALYKNTREESKLLLESIKKLEDRDLRRNRLFLYYLQNGKCLYTGTDIDLNRLYDKNMYDIDHIYPRSITKDNSLNNLILVTRQSNADKTDNYPVDGKIQDKMNQLWNYLKINNYMSDEKYNRLTRKTELTEEEKSKFIARQLVETRQSSKAAAEILKRMCPDSELIYVKAGNVSDFRNKENLDLIKVRDINNYHHAKDAYLNIVVGNVYHTKFTSNPLNFVKKAKKRAYNLERMYDFKVERNGEVAWDVENSIRTVKMQMKKNNILVTKKAIERKGGFFDQQLMKKGKGQYPIKTSDERLHNIKKYGGYNKVSNAYFALVQHEKKGKIIRSIEKVPILIVEDIRTGKLKLEDYYKDSEGLLNPKVLIDRILTNSLLEIDGFRLNITGSSGEQYLFANAIELVLDYDMEKYIKKLVNLSTRLLENKGKYKIDKYDRVSKEENMELYRVFEDKLNNSIYSNIFSKFGELLRANIEDFKELDLEKQVYTLLEILKLFTTDRRASDLRTIGGAETSGTIKKSKKIDGFNEIYIIHQSISGLFEKKVNLLEI